MGVLKARIDGQWVPIMNDGGTAARWNSAWGAVAVGQMKASPINYGGASVLTSVTELLAFKSIVGRRYVFHCRIRAVAPGVPSSGFMILKVNGAYWSDTHTNTAQNTHATLDHFWAGDGNSNTYEVVWQSGQAAILYPDQWSSYFWIEDVGPTSVAPLPVGPTPAWTNLTLLDGWTAESGGFQQAQYRLLGDMVQVRGTIQKTGGAVPSNAFYLPLGYRPSKQLRFGCPVHKAGVGGMYLARCDVPLDGAFRLNDITPSMTDPVVYLSPIQFSIAP